jgi:hypothetical protein
LFSFADDSFIFEYLRACFLHLPLILKPSQPRDDIINIIIIIGFRVSDNSGKASPAYSCIDFARDGNTTTCGVEKKMVSFWKARGHQPTEQRQIQNALWNHRSTTGE